MQCPKCGEENPSGSIECLFCGIVFEKYKKQPQGRQAEKEGEVLTLNTPDAICPYCREVIQKDAIKCKHCGEFLSQSEKAGASNDQEKSKQPSASDYFYGIIGFILIFSAVYYFAPMLINDNSNGTKKSESLKSQEPTKVVESSIIEKDITPSRLWESFNKNELAFESEYSEPFLLVGTVEKVSRASVTGELSVKFSAGGIRIVHCYLSERYKAFLEQIKPGDKLELQCSYKTKMLTTIFFDCELP